MTEVEGYAAASVEEDCDRYKNVYEQKGGFKAMRMVEGKMVHIGSYDTAVEAAVAYAKHAAGRWCGEPGVA